jgi:hypothetical protein
MTSPDLTDSLCGVCLGPVTAENSYDGVRDLHRGRCAFFAGFYPAAYKNRAGVFKDALLALKPGTEAYKRKRKEYFDWVNGLGLEDHEPHASYWDAANKGPKD